MTKRGSGSVYLRGRIWWIRYWDHGRPRAESSGGEDEQKARALLLQRVADVAAGRDLTPDTCTVDDLCQLVLSDYRLRRLKSTKITEWVYNAHVKATLGRYKAAKLTTAILRRHIEERRNQEAAEASINAELSIISRAYHLGMREDPPLVKRIPHIPRLGLDNARQGFVDPEAYERLIEFVPARLKAIFVCAYHVGTRVGELRQVRLDQVDLDAMVIRLEKAQTKGKRARTLPIYGDMERWIRQQIENAPKGCQWLFYGNRGGRIENNLTGWREACIAAGMPDLLFHDLRRSAVRNMKRAGISDKTAMDISGHKTRAIFDRYDIVDEHDVEQAGEKLTQYFETRKAARAAKLRRVK